ncbi:MAG: hypothetical protein R2741_03280 [Methanolobus sp.]
MGISNICVMTGDHTTKGDHPGTKPVYDLDSVQLLTIINKMKQGYDLAEANCIHSCVCCWCCHQHRFVKGSDDEASRKKAKAELILSRHRLSMILLNLKSLWNPPLTLKYLLLPE